MSSLKFAVLAGVAAAALATSASSTTFYVQCNATNFNCIKVSCNDDTGQCRWTRGSSARYGAFARSTSFGYYQSYGDWICSRGPGCRTSNVPPIAPELPSP